MNFIKSRSLRYLSLLLVLMILGCNIIKPIEYDPKTEVNTTDRLSWNKMFNNFKVTRFNVEVVESKLSLFNRNSLLKYSIEGTMSDTNYVIQEVIHMKRLIQLDSTDHPTFEIELVPKVDYKPSNVKPYRNISFTNEFEFSTAAFGKNTLIFKCQHLTDTITLMQFK